MFCLINNAPILAAINVISAAACAITFTSLRALP
jgi:hypothetical protein